MEVVIAFVVIVVQLLLRLVTSVALSLWLSSSWVVLRRCNVRGMSWVSMLLAPPLRTLVAHLPKGAVVKRIDHLCSSALADVSYIWGGNRHCILKVCGWGLRHNVTSWLLSDCSATRELDFYADVSEMTFAKVPHVLSVSRNDFLGVGHILMQDCADLESHASSYESSVDGASLGEVEALLRAASEISTLDGSGGVASNWVARRLPCVDDVRQPLRWAVRRVLAMLTVGCLRRRLTRAAHVIQGVDDLPKCPQVCVVHGDLRLDNVFLANGRVEKIVDWALVSMGDPSVDIASALLDAPSSLLFDQTAEVARLLKDCCRKSVRTATNSTSTTLGLSFALFLRVVEFVGERIVTPSGFVTLLFQKNDDDGLMNDFSCHVGRDFMRRVEAVAQLLDRLDD